MIDARPLARDQDQRWAGQPADLLAIDSVASTSLGGCRYTLGGAQGGLVLPR
ncbi:MAG TPA: hypothetical protein VHN14_22830 [Kofleriaceae bacterium]|jgi:hypothetical protein|nr:hypothetical protein [Kofleriaceae bacterium]